MQAKSCPVCRRLFVPSSRGAAGRRQVHCSRTCEGASRTAEPRPTCRVLECERPAKGRRLVSSAKVSGYCEMHAQRIRNGRGAGPAVALLELPKPQCSVAGCERLARARGWCSPHWQRWRKHGDPEKLVRPGLGWLNEDGYRVVRRGGQDVLEHRWIMQQHLGRCLYAHEEVHHRNGVRTDNAIANLELWSKSQPSGQRVTDKVAWAVELLELYAPELLAGKPVQLRLIT